MQLRTAVQAKRAIVALVVTAKKIRVGEVGSGSSKYKTSNLNRCEVQFEIQVQIQKKVEIYILNLC